MSVAWVQVFSSLPFWSVVGMHIGYNWGYYTFVSVLPAYMANIQHFTVRNVSLLPDLSLFVYRRVMVLEG